MHLFYPFMIVFIVDPEAIFIAFFQHYLDAEVEIRGYKFAVVSRV